MADAAEVKATTRIKLVSTILNVMFYLGMDRVLVLSHGQLEGHSRTAAVSIEFQLKKNGAYRTGPHSG
jgi:hypothetical protein